MGAKGAIRPGTRTRTPPIPTWCGTSSEKLPRKGPLVRLLRWNSEHERTESFRWATLELTDRLSEEELPDFVSLVSFLSGFRQS